MDKELLMQIAEMMEEHTKRIEIKIENEVTKKIEALFDGYKLTHEKQWELERRMDKLEAIIREMRGEAS